MFGYNTSEHIADTDINGKARLKTEREPAKVVVFFGDGYYGETKDIKGPEGDYVLTIYPIGWINFKLKNTAPNNQNDVIIFNGSYPGHVGMNVDTSIVYGGHIVNYNPYPYSYEVSKGASTNYYNGSINLVAKDTVLVEINY